MGLDGLALLRLLQLADSALPVGTAAHSFGLESLFEDGVLAVEGLEHFLRGYLEESGALDAGFCRAAYQISRLEGDEFTAEWRDLNEHLTARKTPRESREASLALGRRFLGLASELLQGRLSACPTHHVTAFGLVAAYAGLDESSAVLAWLHQSIAALISAAQRLAPVGQTRASQIFWALKPLMAGIARTPGLDCFMPLPEIASMRHARMATRLFIS